MRQHCGCASEGGADCFCCAPAGVLLPGLVHRADVYWEQGCSGSTLQHPGGGREERRGQVDPPSQQRGLWRVQGQPQGAVSAALQPQGGQLPLQWVLHPSLVSWLQSTSFFFVQLLCVVYFYILSMVRLLLTPPPPLTCFFFPPSRILRQQNCNVGHRRHWRPLQLQSCVSISKTANRKIVLSCTCDWCVFAAVFSQLLVLEGSATPLHLCLPLGAPGSHLLTACDDGLHCYNTQLGSNTKRCARARETQALFLLNFPHLLLPRLEPIIFIVMSPDGRLFSSSAGPRKWR